MTDVKENKKRSPLILLAILAFIGIIALVSWLSVQLVNSMPNAISSLASIAESVNQQTIVKDSVQAEPQTLVVTSDKTLINSQDTIELSWNTTKTPGSYTFSYACTDGIAVNIVDGADSFRNITCDTNYNVGNTDSLILSAESEKTRFENVNYTVSFLTTTDTSPWISGSASFMVVNSAIQSGVTAQEDLDINTAETGVTENETETSEPEKPVSGVTPPTPVFEQEFTYTIPTSDPNGRVDLSTQFIATGIIINNSFFPRSISRNENGAIQFEVKNYGTKTSDEWVFSVTMPNGSKYESADQQPLKPNERAVLTIGFASADVIQHTFFGRVDEQSDTTTLNDQFVQSVTFTR
jgi:hypothetical protein